jgi:hypothetical protein
LELIISFEMSLLRRFFSPGQQIAKSYVDAGTALLNSLINALGLPGWKDLLPAYSAEEVEAIDSGLSQFQDIADKTVGGEALFHPEAVSEVRRSLAASQLFEFAEDSWRFLDDAPTNWREIASTYLKFWVGSLDPIALQRLGKLLVAAGYRTEGVEAFKVILLFPSYANTFYGGEDNLALVEQIVSEARDALSSLKE